MSLQKFLIFLLTTSICLNVYLFASMYRWKLAWGEQFISTDQIEDILIDSGADISFASVHKIAEARYGTGVEVVEVDPEQQHYGVDKKALSIFGTLLIFRDGQFAGSRANLPN